MLQAKSSQMFGINQESELKDSRCLKRPAPCLLKADLSLQFPVWFGVFAF